VSGVPSDGGAPHGAPQKAPASAQAFAGSRIDHAELGRIARDVFGLRRPVELSRRYMRTYWGHARSWPWEHKVVISSDHDTIEAACRTLAHELTHCVQAESMDHMEWVRHARLQHATLPHDERPIEIEAEEWAEEFWTELLSAIRPALRSEDA
jgi:hypothetical protein